ncbi:hypothetical protein LC085_17030 [Bacillus tianshenii]|nr:hypothetical protein [Bacillus tianshenii]MCA1321612.1 hypothetical protein [Bacillus tianshenii]
MNPKKIFRKNVVMKKQRQGHFHGSSNENKNTGKTLSTRVLAGISF